MDQRNWYFRQPLKEGELDGVFASVDQAIWNVVKDLRLFGLASGAEITSVSPLIASIAAFTGYDPQGRRLVAGAMSGYDFTNDSDGNPNTPSAGNFRYVTFVARHGYTPSDSRTDGNGDPLYFILYENISSTADATLASAGQLQIIQGAEAAAANLCVRPAYDSTNDLVIGDVIIDDTGTIVSVDYSRQQQIPALAVTVYSSLNSYYPGQIVLYQGQLYQTAYTTPPGVGPTNKSYWHVYGRSPVLGSFTSPAGVFLNAQRQQVAGFDHWGFPSGKIVSLEENWIDMNAGAKTNTGTGGWFGQWAYRVNNGGGLAGTGINANGPSSPSTLPWGPLMGMNVFGQSVNAAATVESWRPLINMQGASIVMEWAFSLFDGGGSGVPLSLTSWAMGLSFGTVISDNNTSPADIAGINGAYIHARGADTDWSTTVNNGSDPGAGTGTGITIGCGEPHFAKIIITGATADDGGTQRCLFYIDGIKVTDIPANIIATANMTGNNISPFFRVSASQGEVIVLYIGPVRAYARIALNDEFGP